MEKEGGRNSILKCLRDREYQMIRPEDFISKNHVTSSLLHRLGLQSVLEGHGGCVNCLQWNSTGETLASGSDDLKIILWDPFRINVKKAEIRTNHHSNIFSVKFMPSTNDRVLASGAADSLINIYDVNREETIEVFTNHLGRVKRLEVVPEDPNLLLSASEDGTVLQFDLRTPVNNLKNNVLVNLMSVLGKKAEAKCLSVNPTQPELLAVGANDPYIRVYDRRMIKPIIVQVRSLRTVSRVLWIYIIFNSLLVSG